MDGWLIAFVGIVTVVLLLQTALLAGMYLQFRRTNQRVEQVTRELREGALPILSGVQALVEDARGRVAGMLEDTSEITRLALDQVQRVDRMAAEGADRLRLQLLHVDQILTGTLAAVEDTGATFRRGVSRPLQSIVALIRGVQIGIEFYRGSNRQHHPRPTEVPTEHQDETLFI